MVVYLVLKLFLKGLRCHQVLVHVIYQLSVQLFPTCMEAPQICAPQSNVPWGYNVAADTALIQYVIAGKVVSTA